MLEDKSIGLVLSGGGVRGMAHIGLIKAMREHQIEAKVVAGTSIGALVGAGNVSTVTIADVNQSNGVIHVVDTVVLPSK